MIDVFLAKVPWSAHFQYLVLAELSTEEGHDHVETLCCKKHVTKVPLFSWMEQQSFWFLQQIYCCNRCDPSQDMKTALLTEQIL